MGALISRRVITAAAKLAAFYTAFVLLEILLLGLTSSTGSVILRDTAGIASFLSIPFAFAFLLLAIARRWGLVAFWALLVALWIGVLADSQPWIWQPMFSRDFLAWSVLALPLWVVGHAGILRTSTRRISGSMLLLVCWGILLFSAQFYASQPIPEWIPPHRFGIADLLAWIWVPMPLVLSAFAIRHVCRGTAKPIAA